MRRALYLLCLLPLLVLTACDDDEGGNSVINYDAIDLISYSQHVQPIFSASCTRCHGPNLAEAGLRLDSWENIVKGSDNGEALIAFRSDDSRIMRMLTKLVGGPHPAEVGSTALLPSEQTFLARWIDEGAINDAKQNPYQNASDLLYVCCQDAAQVRIVDMASNNVIRVVDLVELGYSDKCSPHHVAVEPDGSYWYVSLIGDNRVVKLNPRNEVVTDISIIKPGLLEIDPNSDLLYISRSMTAPQDISTVGVIDRGTMLPVIGDTDGEIPVQFELPHALELDASGRYLYTGSLVEGAYMRYDTQSEDLISGSIAPGSGPLEAELSPDGSRLFYTGQADGKLYAFNVNGGDEPVAASTLEIGSKPWHMDFAPDGELLYVALNGDNRVAVVNSADNTLRAMVQGNGLAMPHGVVVSPDGKYVYVSNRNKDGSYTPRHDFGNNEFDGTLVVISTFDSQIVKVLELAALPTGANIAR